MRHLIRLGSYFAQFTDAWRTDGVGWGQETCARSFDTAAERDRVLRDMRKVWPFAMPHDATESAP